VQDALRSIPRDARVRVHLVWGDARGVTPLPAVRRAMDIVTDTRIVHYWVDDASTARALADGFGLDATASTFDEVSRRQRLVMRRSLRNTRVCPILVA